MNIFIDVETVPAGEKPTLNDLKVPGTMSKPETIQKWLEDSEAREADLENMYRKRSLDYAAGRVLCIAFAVGNAPIEGILNNNEERLFKDFEATLGKHDGVYRAAPTLIGHNLKIFDAPYLFLRACKYKCYNLIAILSPPNHSDFFKDTMRMFCLTDFKGMVSLKNACAFFGINAKTGMEGDQVYDEYLSGNTEGILSYCMEDVENVRKLYNILIGSGKI